MPVIGLSGRGKRLDKVIFTLLHEVAHLALGHVTPEALLIETLDGEDIEDSDELEANKLAGAWVLPHGLPRLPQLISRAWATQQAGELDIHPIVLVGRLQKERRLPWRTPLSKDAPSVASELESWPTGTTGDES